MKKFLFLLTTLLLGFIVVSCSKNELSTKYTNINDVEAVQCGYSTDHKCILYIASKNVGATFRWGKGTVYNKDEEVDIPDSWTLPSMDDFIFLSECSPEIEKIAGQRTWRFTFPTNNYHVNLPLGFYLTSTKGAYIELSENGISSVYSVQLKGDETFQARLVYYDVTKPSI